MDEDFIPSKEMHEKIAKIVSYCKQNLSGVYSGKIIYGDIAQRKIKELVEETPPPLPYLGAGCSRVVFKLDDNFAIKIPMNILGINGNRAEYQLSQHGGEKMERKAKTVYFGTEKEGNTSIIELCEPLAKGVGVPTGLIRDSHIFNFGMINGQVVALDYYC